VVSNGQYKFLRILDWAWHLPIFRSILIVFAGLIIESIIVIYMDDLIIPLIDFVEGIQRLAKILEVTNINNLSIN